MSGSLKILYGSVSGFLKKPDGESVRLTKPDGDANSTTSCEDVEELGMKQKHNEHYFTIYNMAIKAFGRESTSTETLTESNLAAHHARNTGEGSSDGRSLP